MDDNHNEFQDIDLDSKSQCAYDFECCFIGNRIFQLDLTTHDGD
jgi:hypothetical protein